MDLKKMPPSGGYNYICNIVDCHSRYAFGGAIKQKTAKEVAAVILKFIYIFGPTRILQTDNGKEFNNDNLNAVMEEFKTRKINGRPYHPQSQGRAERFNRTVVAYFRTQFVNTRDWPSMLNEFYYKYNNRINKSTKPLTPHQRFFKRPNFSLGVEEQVPRCNLTKEENEFLESAHLDVDDEETEESEIMDVVHQIIEPKDSELQYENTTVTTETTATETSTTETSQKTYSTLDKTSETGNETNMNEVETHSFVENLWNKKITDIIDKNEQVQQNHVGEERRCSTQMQELKDKDLTPEKEDKRSDNTQMSDLIKNDNTTASNDSQVGVNKSRNEIVLADITNTQLARNADKYQADVSPYYRQLYARRFLTKKRHSDPDVFVNNTNHQTMNRELWDTEMYPVELFPKRSNITQLDKFEPNLHDNVDFRPNSALSAGTNVFLSGYWKKGEIIDIQCDDSRGKVFTVKDCLNGRIHVLSKYLIRPNTL